MNVSEINDKNKPLVSVIIPTYKRPIFLPRAIDSVLKSTWKNVEIIIVDDNNEGDTFRKETESVMDEIMSVNDNIVYTKHKYNKNGSAARNTGIGIAKGKYIMFLDDDDEFLPDKIEQQVMFMETHNNDWGACYTKYIDKKKNKVKAVSAESASGNLLVNELARNLFVHAGSNLMVRKEVVLALNGFDESFLRNQDVEFLVRLLKKYKLGYVNVTGLVVNLHERKYPVSYYDLTEQYINKFQQEIDQLPLIDQEAVYRMIGLQMIRYAVQKKEIRKVAELKRLYNVKTRDMLLFYLYLAKRALAHKAYGYPMKNLYR